MDGLSYGINRSRAQILGVLAVPTYSLSGALIVTQRQSAYRRYSHQQLLPSQPVPPLLHVAGDGRDRDGRPEVAV